MNHPAGFPRSIPLVPQPITDDLDALFAALPAALRHAVERFNNNHRLLEIVMDLGRPPAARYTDGEVLLSEDEVERTDLDGIVQNLGKFGDDNRAGIERTLHRISCLRNRRGEIVGLTMRVGRAVYGSIRTIEDLVMSGKSILLLGYPGVGKTTMLREVARVLSESGKRVVIVDTSNEIAGDGDIPHPGIGRARRMQVPTPVLQHAVMVEAVENHMPEVIVIDEIGTELEAQAARTIAERGVQLVATAHGNSLTNLMLNPTLADLIGGIQSVTLSDEEARRRGTRKSVLERKAPPTFDILVKIQSFTAVSIHQDVAHTVDALLRGRTVQPMLRELDEHNEVRELKAPATTLAQPLRPQEFAERWDPDDEPIYAQGNGAALAVPPGPHRSIYPFGISPSRLTDAIRQTRVNASVVSRMEDADAMMTLRTIFRRRPAPIRDAEDRNLPIYVLKHNTVLQMDQSLRSLARGHRQEDVVTAALAEAEGAIESLSAGQQAAVELSPQNAYIRRLQHELAQRYELASTSKGREPYRGVRLFRE